MNWLGDTDFLMDVAIEKGRMAEVSPLEAELACSRAEVKPFFVRKDGDVLPIGLRWAPKDSRPGVDVLEDFVRAYHSHDRPRPLAMFVPRAVHAMMLQQTIMASLASPLSASRTHRRAQMHFMGVPVHMQTEDAPL